MNKTLISSKIATTKSNYFIWNLSPDAMKNLNLTPNRPATLMFGSSAAYVNVTPMYPKHPVDIKMGMSAKTRQKLSIPANISLSVKPVGYREFRLGPVIGILTFRHIMAKKNFRLYRNYASRLKNGLLYVFGSNNIKPHTNTITGYYFNPAKKTWEPGEFPYPDVIMDRCYPNSYETHAQLEKVIGEGKIFNKKTRINKLEFYDALCKQTSLAGHLPETKMFDSPSDLEYFLYIYNEVFLKPLNGMQGKGIITISSENDGFKCQYMVNGKNIEEKLPNCNQIIEALPNMGCDLGRYIIQKAIPRMEFRGRPFSFRVIVYKDGMGRWMVPAIFPKMAPLDSFLTNHASGASFVPLKTIFTEITEILPYSKTEYINIFINLALETARVLDRKYGPLGKLGIDVVLDKHGKPWLIEANGNPGLVPKEHMVEFPNWSHQVFRLPLSYSCYLAGFNN